MIKTIEKWKDQYYFTISVSGRMHVETFLKISSPTTKIPRSANSPGAYCTDVVTLNRTRGHMSLFWILREKAVSKKQTIRYGAKRWE